MTFTIEQLIEGIKDLGDVRKMSTAELVAELANRFAIPTVQKYEFPDLCVNADNIVNQNYVATDSDTADVITL